MQLSHARSDVSRLDCKQVSCLAGKAPMSAYCHSITQTTQHILSGASGSTRWAGPDLGHHTEEILVQELSYSKDEISRLRTEGVI